jgi:hypothetical protein
MSDIINLEEKRLERMPKLDDLLAEPMDLTQKFLNQLVSLGTFDMVGSFYVGDRRFKISIEEKKEENMDESVEIKQSREVMARLFDAVPMTDAQKKLAVILGAKPYLCGCKNGMMAMHDAGKMAMEMSRGPGPG